MFMKSTVSLTNKTSIWFESVLFGSSLEGTKVNRETTFTLFLPMTTCIAST